MTDQNDEKVACMKRVKAAFERLAVQTILVQMGLSAEQQLELQTTLMTAIAQESEPNPGDG